MGGAETLTPARPIEDGTDEEPTAPTDRQPATGCPGCEETWGALGPLDTSLFASTPLQGCRRCGGRFAIGAEGTRVLLTCDRCSLPFVAEPPSRSAAADSADDEPLCPDCREGHVPTDLLDAALIRATETELRLALERQWRFVTARRLSAYLQSIVRRVGSQIDGAPSDCVVQIVDEADLLTLALPSGTVLMSVGLLAALEDEAELAFVLAHEMTHAASADAAVRLVRLGLRAAADAHDPSAGPEAWGRAADDLVALGYGPRREREADDRAMAALLQLDYDTNSVGRFFERLDARVDDGDPRVRRYAFGHPSPSARWRRIESRVFAEIRPAVTVRVNRELFRRAAGRSVLDHELVAVERIGGALSTIEGAQVPPGARAPWFAVGVTLALAALALALLALLA